KLLIFLVSGIILFAAKEIAFAQTSTTINLNLDPAGAGVTAVNVVNRNLYLSTEASPLSGFPPKGVGSYRDGSIQYPFTATTAGNYSFVFSYYQIAAHRLMDVKVDGQSPSGWSQIDLWPNSPDYKWGSTPQFYGGAPPAITWSLPGTVNLATGSHTIEFDFHNGGVVLKSAYFTQGAPPTNPANPWAIVGNSVFPALDFSNHQVTTLSDGRIRITFNGTWTNLAPSTVSFGVTTSVMPRSGKTTSVYSVTSVSTGSTLQLARGQSTPFSLTVESNAPVPANYSELVRLDLKSNDIANLSKPYLMSAANGYLPMQTVTKLAYVKDYNAGGFAPVDTTDMTNVIPTRQSFGFQNGIYQQDVTGAFVYALTHAPSHIMTKGGFDLTNWALTRPGTLLEDATRTNRSPYLGSPLSTVLAGIGQNSSTAELKSAMQVLSNEVPYYFVPRWDIARPFILPATQYEFGGVTALTSYVKLLQQNAMTDDEHFRFLHNVILPLFLSYRDDLRISGTLAQNYSPGQANIYFNVKTAPFMDMANESGEWIRLGTGSNMEYIHMDVQALGGNGFHFYAPTKMFGNATKTHLAGEPFVSYHMREAVELEGTDIWTFLAAAASSRDSAVQEQAAEWINTLYTTQNLFREDGSFANEPGSYGWPGVYMDLANEASAFLSTIQLPAFTNLKDLILKSLVMWNEFPFSDGSFPMLNGGGAVNQLTRAYGNAFALLKLMYPDRTDLISYFQNTINQENSRKAGSTVDNQSFKIDGWGYAMLRGPGSWDTRMETLLSSKHLGFYPGDHVSGDGMGIVAFANGTILTPRYGYDWRGYPYLLLNKVMIDRSEPGFWGDFVHFDPDPNTPSAVATTEMAASWSTTPGMAHQERWNVQLPEYLFDTFIVKPRDGAVHRIEWGYRNMGELAISNPTVALSDAKDPSGADWDPFGYYITNTGHKGQQFTATGLWQGDWTMNEGSIMQDATYAWPPKGSKMRLTMEGVPNTKVTVAWLTGPARNQTTNLRQDFAVAERNGTEATYVDTLEPIGVGKSGFIQNIQTTATNSSDNSRSVKVTTSQGTDWFLVGTSNFKNSRSSRTVGPFTTDAALAVIRIKNNQVVSCKFFGGTSFAFSDNGVSSSNCQGGVTAPSPTPSAVVGDANGDGKVDGIDYVTVILHFGQTTTRGPMDGDLNIDGKVDQSDLDLVVSKLL
ncbi:hypothetical protein HYS03_00295, partial [Candidatus Woesebacteria bacterium]|nr:hypothetical protein [Candidatus Woesebacteria bacterium]